MANMQYADLCCGHDGTKLFLCHSYMNIGISEDQNWTNAAIALFKKMQEWQENSHEAKIVDPLSSILDENVQIARLIIDYKNMEISFSTDTPAYGYDGGQHHVFNLLKEQFDRIKKLPAFW